MTKRSSCGDHTDFKSDSTPASSSSSLNKKPKVDGDMNSYGNNDDGASNAPSHVVHVRNLPPDASEADLMSIGTPFGKIAGILMLQRKNQALIEYSDIKSATCMVNYWGTNGTQPNVRGRNVFVQFSNHNHLQKDAMNGSSSNMNGGHNMNVGSQEATAVLRVVMDAMQYPVNLEGLHQIFSRFGTVSKIVTFNKNGNFQALIQFESLVPATQAKNALDGQPMYAPQVVNANILRIGFSKLNNLNVKYNNEKSRDYTNPHLPSGGANNGMASSSTGGNNYGGGDYNPSMMMGGNHMGGGSGGGPYGNSRSGGPNFNGGMLGGRDMMMGGRDMNLKGPVLLVSNIPEQIANPDALFTLFGVYGDVQRVKVLYNKQDNALIQMANMQQAAQAIAMLCPMENNSGVQTLRLYGNRLKISPSKFSYVQMPQEGSQEPEAALTKEYLNSPLHRFKRPASKNYNNIFPPSTTLHLSNIPASVEEQDIRRIFAEQLGGDDTIRSFRFFKQERKMALISLATIEDSVSALIKLHNYQLEEASHLRISFSKTTI